MRMMNEERIEAIDDEQAKNADMASGGTNKGEAMRQGKERKHRRKRKRWQPWNDSVKRED